jgi:hypothetical protein
MDKPISVRQQTPNNVLLKTTNQKVAGSSPAERASLVDKKMRVSVEPGSLAHAAYG